MTELGELMDLSKSSNGYTNCSLITSKKNPTL